MRDAVQSMKSGEMPNLLDLVETIETNISVACEQGSGLASDDASISGHSLCSDEFNDRSGQPVRIAELSVCADEVGTVSDVRLKDDIAQVGSTVYGLPLFHFRYKGGSERFEGVMAQDVMQVMPDAVSVGNDGFYRVNYARLGISMTRV
jgi:Chaperone of endosialidase